MDEMNDAVVTQAIAHAARIDGYLMGLCTAWHLSATNSDSRVYIARQIERTCREFERPLIDLHATPLATVLLRRGGL